jgi:hypothetical protein
MKKIMKNEGVDTAIRPDAYAMLLGSVYEG